MQVARFAEAVRQLGHHLHAHESLVQERRDGSGLREATEGYRRIVSRFEKLDVVFLGFIAFAFIVEALR
jgi:hypothetical protein